MDLQGRTVLVLGLGESGLAMARWLAREGAHVRVADTRDAPPYADDLRRTVPAAELVTGAFSEMLLAGVEAVGLSPGLPRAQPFVQTVLARGLALVSEIELFAQALVQLSWRDDTEVMAITGTNGKTTVTTLAGEMCRAAGVDTVVAGNIGPAALSALMDRLDRAGKPRAWVLELSSFQLELTETLNADAAAVLNVTDDHLDRYDGIGDYAAAKARVFAGGGIQVLNRDDPTVIAMRRPGYRALTFGLDRALSADDFGVIERGGDSWLARGRQLLMPVADLRLTGLHNVANALAALALCAAAGLPMEPLLHALRAFRGLPHRVERIAEIDGVAFFDDSKGTNVGATLAALSGLGQKAALIAGGDGKGQDFSPLKAAVERHAKAVILIGRDAPLIEAALAGASVPVVRACDMNAAVEHAFAAVRRGEAVLLSPACASFDMFRDYVDRAKVFAQATRGLARRRRAAAQ